MNAQSPGSGEFESEPVRQDLDLTSDTRDRSRNAPMDVAFTDDPRQARKQRIRRATRKALRTIGSLPRVDYTTDLTADPINPTPTNGSRPIISRHPEPADPRAGPPQRDEPTDAIRHSGDAAMSVRTANAALVGVPVTWVTTGSVGLTIIAAAVAAALVLYSLVMRRRR